MKILKSIFAIMLIGLGTLSANDKYGYILDLTKVEDDKLMVQLITPDIKESTINFYLPKIIPGTYKVADYGRFASDLKAYDKKGRELKVDRLDDNTWKISKANKMKKITYLVGDTYDGDQGDNQIYPMAGTNIEDGQNFVINTSGFFGYFEGMKELQYDLRVIRPEEFYGATGLIATPTSNLQATLGSDYSVETPNAAVDLFEIDNYNLLIDSPLMYNKPDTAIVDVAGTQVLISVYSPKGMVQANYVAENIEQLLHAQKEYLGGTLPVDKYAFILYFEDLQKLAPIQGALEHSYSSFYYLPEVPQENLRQTLVDVAAHEFFHIVTPLNIHSEEIHYFDFNDPQMSKHLWLYEGVTEYSAGHVQVKYDLLTPDQYLDVIRNKMVAASTQFNDTLPFTDLSEFTLTKYPDQYSNVYQKGALIGMALDIKLLELSDGQYGIQNLIADLAKTYGKDQAFKDDELFGEIAKLSYPEITDFMNTYIAGSTPLPYTELFQLVGVNYIESEDYNDFSLGNIGIGFNPETSRIFVNDVSGLDEFGKALGYQNGDVLTKMNGEEIPLQPGLIQGFINNVRQNMKAGEEMTITVMRENESGTQEETTLSAQVVLVPKQRLHQLSFAEDAEESQLALREAWLRPRK